MFTVLGVLGLVLLQEPIQPVRILEDAQAKQRLQQADQHYRLGMAALQAARFEAAEQELRETVRLDPNSFLAWFSLGRTYIALKRYDDSIRAYQSCRPAWDRSAADQKGQTFDRDSRLEDRIRELEDRIRFYENQQQAAEQVAPGSNAERPRFQTEIENVQAEISLLRQVRGRTHGAVDPPAEFSLALGSAHLRAGSIDDAERAYREALQLRPKYGEAHNNLAVICIKRGDYDEAYSHVQAAQKAGFRVHPQLVKDIQTARRAAHE